MREPQIIGGLRVLAVALVLGFLWLSFQSPQQNSGIAFAQGNSSQSPMRGMMRQTMRGSVPPPGYTDATLTGK